MKIRKLHATFGKLQDDTLSLHGGLNVVYAPNESGKSTWCAFIRSMLYGIDNTDGVLDGLLSERTRYAPWSGAPMEGCMDIVADGFDITLRRSTVSGSDPLGDFSAVYTENGKPVEGMTALNCGELLTGVTKDVFRRSAFIGQGAVAVSGGSELEKKIESLVASGEENVSFADAEAQLLAWQRKRRDQQKGMLPALEARISDAEKLLQDMDSSSGSARELERQLIAARQECSSLETAVTDARRRQRADALNQLRQARALVQERRDSHDEALAEISRRKDALRRSDFGDRTASQLEEEVSEARQALDLAKPDHGQALRLVPAIVFSVLAVVLAALYGAYSSLPMILGAALSCTAAVFFFLQYSKRQQQAALDGAVRDKIMRKYKVSLADDLDEITEKHRALETAIEEAEAEEKRSRERLEHATVQLHEREEKAVNELDFVGGDSEAARLSRTLQNKRSEVNTLTAKLSGLNGRLSALGDPMVLGSALSEAIERRETLQEEYDAIVLAGEILRESDEELRGQFSPELSRVAAEYLSEMTGGRYQELVIGQDFSARARSSDDTVARDAGYLSAGTADLVYLAVRLAVCELVLPSGEPCPLILDDTLVNLDNDRYEQAMTLLKKIALNRQVILFTCRKE